MIEAVQSAARIYFDANCIIYFVERTDDLHRKVADLISFSQENRKDLFCSEIGVAECLHGAYRAGSAELEKAYDKIFYDIALFELAPIDNQRARAAAKMGAEKSLKLVDAMHFLAGVEFGCDVFVTNDRRFKASHGISVLILDDWDRPVQ
jgi:predicted nucleic acid-binding protein